MNSHPQYEEDCELYELRVLDGGDTTELEAHLTGCAECRTKLESARSRLALLALAAPDSEPPAGSRERILESFRQDGPRHREEARAYPARRGFWTPVWAWACAGAC